MVTSNLLYPRLIAIHRQRTNAVNSSGQQQVGAVGYSGREQTTVGTDAEGEIVLYTNIPANISIKSYGTVTRAIIPADYVSRPLYLIVLPQTALPAYSIRDGDIIVDDEGYRYGILQNIWTVLGYQLSTIRLES